MTTMLDRLPTGTTWPEALGLDGIEDRANDLLANDLVIESYAITLDPIRFEDLLTVQQDYVESRLAAVHAHRNAESLTSPALESHMQRAFAIFERLGRRRRCRQSAEALVADMPVTALVVDRQCRIIAANDPARLALAATNGELRLAHLGLDEDTAIKLDAWLTGRRTEEQPMIALPCRIGSEQKPSCILGTRVQIGPDDGGVATSVGGHVLLTTIELRFDQSLAAALASAFQLTVAEAEVALSLAKGQAPAAIATLRTVSLMTVRTQIKRILRKLDAAAVPDLVRIVNGFAVSPAMSRASGLAATRPASGDRYRRAGTIILPDGRRLAFEDSGAVKGRSVLFIHDMLHAPGLTDAAIEAAQRKNEENEEEFVRHLLTCRLCWTYAERFRIGDLGDIGSYGDFPMEVCIGQRDRGDR